MVCACTGLPPGELIRRITPWVLFSLNAACSPRITFSALASRPGAMMPFSSNTAVYFLPPVKSPRLLQSTIRSRTIVMYAKVSSLKKMPQRRRRRCSTSASEAIFVIRSRSQFGLFSVIFEPREINHAIALFHIEFQEPSANAGAADAAAGGGLVGRAVGRAKEIASVGIEKYSFLPVEFHRDVRAAIEVGMHRAPVADRDRGRRLAEVFHLEAHAAPRIGERRGGADQPCVASHSRSSATLATQSRGAQARKPCSGCAP